MNLRPTLDSLIRFAGARTGGRWLALGNFFRYHGVYAPGVRLLRSLSIPQKVMVVALCFLLPMALLGQAYLRETLHQRAQIRLALKGTAFAADILELTAAIRAERRRDAQSDAGMTLPPQRRAGPPIAQALDRLAEREQRWRGLFQVQPEFEAARRAVLPLLQAGGTDPEHRLARQGAAIEALHGLLGRVMSQAHVAGEPDAATHELGQAAFNVVPQTMERVAGIRAPGAAYLAGQGGDAVRVRALLALAMAESGMADAARLLAAASERDPTLAPMLGVQAAMAPARAFLAQARAQLGPEAAPGMTPDFVRANTAALDGLELLRDRLIMSVRDGHDARAGAIDRQLAALGATVLLCVLLAVYLLLSFYRVMDGGLGLLQQQVSRMADGDLSARPRPWGSDEVARALASLGDSLAKLGDLFAAVKQGVSAISHASTAIAEGTSDLSARTDESVAGVAQILRGVESYVEQLEQAGRRVDEAVEAVHALRLDAVRSREHMQRLEERMQSLRGKSREISEIVELIDNIAFRTNILALNASVEASKAGEAGRSFAVVAQEVRQLAARSAASAKRITGIVSGSTADIEQSGALVELAAQALVETDGHVGRIHEAMGDIVTLTRDGQHSSQDILAEIRGVNELAGRHRTLVAQMAAAADDLSRQGDRLNDKVRGFKLG